MLGCMFVLETYLNEKRSAIEAAIDLALPSADTPPARLHEAIRYSVLTGGKRLRPILSLAAAESVGADRGSVLPAAMAVELLHTYTLIHDDLPCMDDDDERRGRPTSHKVFGEANAILAGDALQALAFELAARSAIDPGKVVLELARAAGSQGVVGGQVADIAAGNNMTREQLAFIHEHKTADLFRAAVRMGAIAGGASEEQLANLTTYGANIGLAFQIIDDILDAEDPTDESCSCITLYGMVEARRLAATYTHRAVNAVTQLGKPAVPLIEIAEHMLERTH
jgi:geranylgeranyl diphosphate synthase type II